MGSVEPGEKPRPELWTGLLAVGLGLGGAMLAHQLVPGIGVLTWAVALGMVAGNTRLLPLARGRRWAG